MRSPRSVRNIHPPRNARQDSTWGTKQVKPKPKTIVYNREWEPEGTRERYRWVENASRGLRIVGAVDEIKPDWRPLVDHRGWYLDPWGEGEVARGYVLQLPARDREPQYIPAIADAWNPDSYICDFHSCTSDLREAIYAADSMAERYAEREREYRLAESAKLRAEELRKEATAARLEASKLARNLRTDGHALPPSIRDVVRLRMRDLRANVREALKEAARLDAEPWTILN